MNDDWLTVNHAYYIKINLHIIYMYLTKCYVTYANKWLFSLVIHKFSYECLSLDFLDKVKNINITKKLQCFIKGRSFKAIKAI